MYSVIVDSLRLIRNGDGVEEVYRLYEDPWEERNIPAASTATKIEGMRAALPPVPARNSEREAQ